MEINPTLVKAYATLLQIELGNTELPKYITSEIDRKNELQILLNMKSGYEEAVALYLIEQVEKGVL